jgi:UDP-N-acetyl-D-mannosaminuronic acid dehydrogenase
MHGKTVAVVGLGYVGLPLACSFASTGLRTIGYDIVASKVEMISAGKNPIEGDEPGLSELLSDVHRKGLLEATLDPKALAEADAIFVCVDSPVDEHKRPVLRFLRNAVGTIAQNMKRDSLLSIESTIPPGTMEGVVVPAIREERGFEPGKDYMLVHCPERVMPGRLLRNIREYDRILGAYDSRSAEAGIAYYSKIVQGRIHPTSLINAEITKTAENAYRDVQIAFANEVALLCEELGADVFKVRELVNTCPFRDMHIPGSGVGGYCLPKDPWLLLSSAKEAPKEIIPAARRVNEHMPRHMIELVMRSLAEKGGPGKARIAIMGLSFLRDSDDTRNSPSLEIIDGLIEDHDLIVHDPFVQKPYKAVMVRDIEKALEGADCAIFVTDHSCYKNLDLDKAGRLMRNPAFVDGRNLFDEERCRSAGIHYIGLGKGRSH